jgi:hypothetical protein
MPIEVLLNHVRMPTVARGVLGWPTKDFSQKGRDVLGVLAGHVGKERGEYCVVSDSLVEASGQAIQGVYAAEPFVERWNGLAHVREFSG